MEYTVIYNDGHTDFMVGSSKEEVFGILEQRGEDFLDVVDGKLNIPPQAIENFKKNPMSILINQIPKEQKKTTPAPNSGEAVGSNPPPVQSPQSPQPRQLQLPPNIPVQYFTRNGVDFKVENGNVFIKEWVEAEEETYKIISKKTNKEFKGDTYVVLLPQWLPANPIER